MRILACGDFADLTADLVRERLPAGFADARETNDDAVTVMIRDSFHSEAMCAGQARTRLLLCFLTNRGLFVSPWLDPAGPCPTCFDRRWLANLAFWEQPPERERELQWMETVRAGSRSVPVPASVAHLASALILQRLDSAEPATAHYVDLVSCEVTRGLLVPVHGCPGCRRAVDPPGRRYVEGLAAIRSAR